MMRQFGRLLALAMVALCLSMPAVAGIGFSMDVLWRPNPNNDVQVFLHASNVAYPHPREHVVEVYNQVPDAYDYAVLAFVAHHARVDLGTVWQYRRAGHPWFDCVAHFGVSPSVLFVDLPRDPGPPYGKAYGHWRKQGDRLEPRYVSDADVRYWVQLQTVTAYTRTPINRVYEQRASGRKFEQIAGGYYRSGKDKGQSASRGERRQVNEASMGGVSSGKGKGKGKGKSNH